MSSQTARARERACGFWRFGRYGTAAPPAARRARGGMSPAAATAAWCETWRTHLDAGELCSAWIPDRDSLRLDPYGLDALVGLGSLARRALVVCCLSAGRAMKPAAHLRSLALMSCHVRQCQVSGAAEALSCFTCSSDPSGLNECTRSHPIQPAIRVVASSSQYRYSLPAGASILIQSPSARGPALFCFHPLWRRAPRPQSRASSGHTRSEICPFSTAAACLPASI
jgi:hypothetical protein